MKKLEETIKDQLETTLDELFPKIEEEGERKRANKRGAALVLYSESLIEIKKLIRAFGGCEKCYGKGYGTQTLNYRGRGESDIGQGDVVVDEKAPTMVFCDCERGKQLKKLIGEQA